MDNIQSKPLKRCDNGMVDKKKGGKKLPNLYRREIPFNLFPDQNAKQGERTSECDSVEASNNIGQQDLRRVRL